MNELEDILKSKDHILIDTSFIIPEESSSLLKSLKEGLNGVYGISAEGIKRSIDKIAELQALICEREMEFLPEIIRELETGLTTIEEKIYRYKRKIRHKSAQKHYVIAEKLEKLRAYAKKLNSLIEFVKSKNKQRGSERDREDYRHYLSIAKNNKGILINSHSKNESNSIGKELETDLHIFATAAIRSYHDPVIILTRDEGIDRLITACFPEISKHLRKQNRLAMHYSISVYNPNL